jgi:N-acetylglucosamine-6-phosphate deacetylase
VRLAGRDPQGGPVEITIDGDVIVSIGAASAGAVPEDQWILPGLVDIQVNGYAGVDLNGPDLDVEAVGRLVRSLHAVGVTRFCPTVCTQSRARMLGALRAIADSCAREAWIDRAVAGIHVEGPYISPEDGPRGSHPSAHVRPPNWDELMAFQDAAGGRIRLLTLSPEWPGAAEFIRRVARTGVVVAIGHTAASPEALREAILAGARLSTHLGNGAHAALPRHPNYIWEQLAADELSASIIADGQHLPPAVVKTFIRAKGIGRIVLISDAVAFAGMPPGDYDWLGQRVTLTRDGRVVLAGTPYLAGSVLTLVEALQNVMEFAGVSLSDAVTMASINPARLIGIDPGALAAGARADLVVLKGRAGTFKLIEIVIGGETFSSLTL